MSDNVIIPFHIEEPDYEAIHRELKDQAIDLLLDAVDKILESDLIDFEDVLEALEHVTGRVQKAAWANAARITANGELIRQLEREGKPIPDILPDNGFGEMIEQALKRHDE